MTSQQLQTTKTTDSEATPLYILKWRLPSRRKERRHMALFIPDANSSFPNHGAAGTTAPATEPDVKARGTLLQVLGSPFHGYSWAFIEGFEFNGVGSRTERGVVEVCEDVGAVEAESVPEGEGVGKMMMRLAKKVPAPGVCRRPWIAEDLKNCQDWIADLFGFLVERGVVSEDVLKRVHALVEPAAPLMRAPPDEDEGDGQGESREGQSVEGRVGFASLGPGPGGLS